MVNDPESVGVELSVGDDVRSSLPPVGSVFDGIVSGCSLRTLSGKRCEFNRQCGERGVLCISGDDGRDGDANVNDFFHNALGKAKGGRWLGSCKDAGKLMDG